jgi:hypothetical protein
VILVIVVKNSCDTRRWPNTKEAQAPSLVEISREYRVCSNPRRNSPKSQSVLDRAPRATRGPRAIVDYLRWLLLRFGTMNIEMSSNCRNPVRSPRPARKAVYEELPRPASSVICCLKDHKITLYIPCKSCPSCCYCPT